MKKISLLLVVLLAMALIFTGCGNDEENNQKAQSNEDNNLAENVDNEENEEGENEEEENQEEGNDVTDAEVVGEWSFTVEIVDGESFEFTNEDAEEIGAVHIMAAQKDGEDTLEEQQWTGILMTDFLQHIGVEDFLVIAIEGANGDSRELESDRIDEAGTGFGWMVDGEVLDEDRGPIQLINHNRGPKWWIEDVTRVTIIQ